jgi:hypothetical protein
MEANKRECISGNIENNVLKCFKNIHSIFKMPSLMFILSMETRNTRSKRTLIFIFIDGKSQNGLDNFAFIFSYVAFQIPKWMWFYLVIIIASWKMDFASKIYIMYGSLDFIHTLVVNRF